MRRTCNGFRALLTRLETAGEKVRNNPIPSLRNRVFWGAGLLSGRESRIRIRIAQNKILVFFSRRVYCISKKEGHFITRERELGSLLLSFLLSGLRRRGIHQVTSNFAAAL